MMRTVKNILLGAAAVLIFAAPGTLAQTAEEIIASHLKAIGGEKERAEVKTLMATGVSEFASVSPVIRGGGKAIVVSNPENLFWVISLNSKEYPFEKVGYFSGKTSLPFINSGNRSLLGIFLNEHDALLSEGLFGGTMSLR